MSTGKCMARQSMQPALHNMHTKPSLPGSQNSTWIKIENTRSGLAKVQRSGQERREPSLWRTNNQAAGLPGTGRPAAFPIIQASGRASSLTTCPAPLQGLTSRQSNRIHHRKNSRPSTKLHFHILQIQLLQADFQSSLLWGRSDKNNFPHPDSVFNTCHYLNRLLGPWVTYNTTTPSPHTGSSVNIVNQDYEGRRK